MGHKVSPIAFRIPYIMTWKSSWYGDKKNYKDMIHVDIQTREILNNELKGIPLGDILISKTHDQVIIDIFTSKASLVLGKTGENVERIKTKLQNKLGGKFAINVKEIKQPDTNAKIVAYSIANQIEKRMPYKRAIKQAVAKAMEKGALGIKVKVGGRLNGAEIARKETFKDGAIPLQTMRSHIDYTTARAETIYGTIGIKVWIYKGDIYKKSKKLDS
ncbi:30S ribosomal protein S3 [Candidatus Gracilibacteria bacterium]|nr:30S ribosomal protein S3 [Candidatus Gracilibacteria bacterium]